MNNRTTPLSLLSLLLGLLFGGGLQAQPLYQVHWDSSSDPVFSGSAAATLTQQVDTACSRLTVSVIDTAIAPMPPFNALIINPQQANGSDLTDLSGNMSFHFRVWSLDTVRLGFLLRSGDGTSAFRTDRLETEVAGGHTSWTELTFTFDASNLAGFDSTDLRDVWIYLDRGTENFAGNQFRFDYFSIGAPLPASTFSPCPVGDTTGTAPSTFAGFHWDSSGDPVFGSSGGAALTQDLDVACSSLRLSVTDTANAPLPALSPLSLDPKLADGSELTDLSGRMSFHLRVRSQDSVRLGLLLRGGNGTSAFRTDRLEAIVPGDSVNWTEITFAFDATNIGGFDSTDLRDIWLYLDAGEENFAGDDFVFDYFYLGAPPDSGTYSTCVADTSGQPPLPMGAYVIHWTEGDDPRFSGSGGDALTQVWDATCETLSLSVADPLSAPLGAFSPVRVNPLNPDSSQLTDLSGRMAFHVRVRSRDSVTLGLLLRSGDGSSSFRTDRLEVPVPGDTTRWTELTFRFDSNTLGGFDSTDLRDIFLYLDPGEDNFAGNEFVFDYFAIGPKPDSSTHSACSLIPPFTFPYVLHWDEDSAAVFGGSEAFKYNQEVDAACSQLKVSVVDPVGDPYGAFKPMLINPQDDFGEDITDLSGNMKVYVRLRSAAAVELSMLLRAGDGGQDARTEIVRQMVPAGLDRWTELVFDFGGANYAGFDSTDLRDMFVFLDRDNANFPGNECYFDYLSIGSPPPLADTSTCVETVSLTEPEAPLSSIFPNPLLAGTPLLVKFGALPVGTPLRLQLFSLTGQRVAAWETLAPAGQMPLRWSFAPLPAGMYLLRIDADRGSQTHKLLVR